MSELWDPVPLPEEPAPPAKRARAPVGRLRRAERFVGRMAVLLGALAATVFFALTHTDRGADFVVATVLARLPVQGEITAREARSDELLSSVRLYGVAIKGSDGRLFLMADSVRLVYNWRTLVSGDVVFDTLEAWRPSVMITRYPGEKEFNAQRLFVSEPEALDTARAPLRNIAFYGVALHGGEMRVLYPAAPRAGARLVTVPAPARSDSVLVRHTFAGLEVRLPSVLLQTPDSLGQRIQIDSLAMLAEVTEDPVRVRDLVGRVLVREERIDMDLETLALDRSSAHGTAFVEFAGGDRPLRYGFDVTSPQLDLDDLAWIDRRVPTGTATGGVKLDASGEDVRLDFRALRVASEGSRVQMNGGVALVRDEVRFRELDVRAVPLALQRLDPWLARPLPVQGSVEGDLRLDGTVEDLETSGHLTLRSPGSERSPTTADFDGTLHLGRRPGAGVGFTELRATLDPFDFSLLGALFPQVKLTGPGRLAFTATGRTTDAVTFRAEVQHAPAGLPRSEGVAQGTVRRRGEAWVLDVGADLRPLSLTALARDYPDLPVTGSVAGSVEASGLLSDLTVTTDLATEAGRLAVTARFDAEHPGERYAVEGRLTQFALSKLAPDLPEPTAVSGYLSLEGRGTDPATLTLEARARLRGSRVGGLIVDTATVAVRAGQGLLTVDTLDAVAGGVTVQASGGLGLVRGGPSGTLDVAFRSDSLARLRPLAFGDVVIARDTLTDLDRELLRAENIDPDTLPTRADVEVAGAVRGNATLTGWIGDFAARGRAAFERVRFSRSVVRGATVDFTGEGLPGTAGRMAATVEADSLDVRGRAFSGARVQVDYTRPSGRLDLRLQRRDDEDYAVRAGFELHPDSGRVDLERVALRFDSLTWALQRPGVLAWTPDAVRIGDLSLASADDSVHVEANGVVPRTRGEADLTVRVRGLPLDRLGGLLQREDLRVAGRLDLDARVTGTAAAPVVAGTFDAEGFDFENWSLSSFAGRLDYADRTLDMDVAAARAGRRVLTATGQVPVDLAFTEVARRVPPDRQMDLTVVADSMPAALALGYFTVLTEVEGTISGQFRVRGTVENPTPSGLMTMNGAAWSMQDLGVRYRDVRGNLRLRDDGVVEVALTGRSGEGLITTAGTLNLHPLTDPTFNLLIGAQTFRAVSRPDVEGVVSGSVTLTGTYARPVVTSVEGYPVRIDEGVIFVEEFQRTVSIVDLADPAFFAVVDTTMVNPRPLLGSSANPFLRNLRVAVDLTAERNAWLRGGDINVEMGGDLQMVYDRQTRELVMLGALNAIRGTYSILGRRFDVQSGTVEFVGTPGIDPQLNIVAVTRVNQGGSAAGAAESGQLNIQATVTGTLEQPRVALSTDNGGIAESDLVSYLVFGVPSYQLGSAQQRAIGQAGFVGSAVGAGVSFLSGTLAAQLSSLVSQEWGIDYFAINQGRYTLDQGAVGLAASLYTTTLEFGFYLEDDVFLTLLVQPLANRGASAGTSTDLFAGARVDWQLPRSWTAQASFETVELRQANNGLGAQQIQPKKVPGLSVFRDWGYGRRGPPPPPPTPAPPGAGAVGLGLRRAPGAVLGSGVGLRWRRIPAPRS